ncbi:MAG: glycosyltransferase [Candidatus Aenigmatarchaeota archaeon]
MSKIAVFHDYFLVRGGGEKIALLLAKHFKSDVYTFAFDPNKSFGELAQGLNIFSSKNIFKYVQNLRQLAAINFFKNLYLWDNYDAHIFTGLYSIYSSMYNHPSIYYCFNVGHNLYDKTQNIKHAPLMRRLALSFLRKREIPRNRFIVRNYIDSLITICNFTAKNIKSFYNIQPEIIHIPVETKKFINRYSEDYYLVVSRLEEFKRVHLVVEAFKKMKDKKVIIIGDGSQKRKLLSLAKSYKNIKFLDVSSQEDLIDYYSRCISVINVPYEDYGMVPIEAAAAGKPSIVSNDLGMEETVIKNKTGFVIKADLQNLIDAVKRMTPEVAESMKKDCLKFSKKFDIDIFHKKWENKIKEVLR